MIQSSTDVCYSAQLLNYVEPFYINGEAKSAFYTTVNTNIQPYDKVFIMNGLYDSDIYISQGKYVKNASGYTVLSVDQCQLVLDIDYSSSAGHTFSYIEDDIDNYTKIYHVGSQREFDYINQIFIDSYSATASVLYPNGRLSKFELGLTNNIIYSDIAFSGTSSGIGQNTGLNATQSFWARVGTEWYNITDNFINDAFPIYTGDIFQDNSRIYIFGEDIIFQGNAYRQRNIYKFNSAKTYQWILDTQYKQPIVSKLNFKQGVFKGIHNDGIYGDYLSIVPQQWNGDQGIWNSGFFVNSTWNSGTMNSKSVVGSTSYYASLNNGIISQSTDNSNNRGYGYNFILDSDIIGGIIGNGNFYNCNVGLTATGLTALDVSSIYPLSTLGGIYQFCNINDISMSSSTTFDSIIDNCYLNNTQLLNSQITSSILDRGSFNNNAGIGILSADMNSYMPEGTFTQSDIRGILKLYISDNDLLRLDTFDNFYITQINKEFIIRNLSNDQIVYLPYETRYVLDAFFDSHLTPGDFCIVTLKNKSDNIHNVNVSFDGSTYTNSFTTNANNYASIDIDFGNFLAYYQYNGSYYYIDPTTHQYQSSYTPIITRSNVNYLFANNKVSNADYRSGVIKNSNWVGGSNVNDTSNIISATNSVGAFDMYISSSSEISIYLIDNKMTISDNSLSKGNYVWLDTISYTDPTGYVTDISGTYSVTGLTTSVNNLLITLQNQSIIPTLVVGGTFSVIGLYPNNVSISTLKIDSSEINSGLFIRTLVTNSTFTNQYFDNTDTELALSNINLLRLVNFVFNTNDNTIESGLIYKSNILNVDWVGGIAYNSIWNGPVFGSGVFEFSHWLSGSFSSGIFINSNSVVVSTFSSTYDYSQVEYYRNWLSGTFNGGLFYNSVWQDGIFNNGKLYNSDWYSGTWNNGILGDKGISSQKTTFGSLIGLGSTQSFWNNGLVENATVGGSAAVYWYNGLFNNGSFESDGNISGSMESIWYDGKFNGGRFDNLAVWINGTFNNGKFTSYYGWTNSNSSFISNYSWQNGIFKGGEFGNASTGTNSTWYSGEFDGGIFQGRVWNSGVFQNGNFYGSGISAMSNETAFVNSFTNSYYGLWRNGFVTNTKQSVLPNIIFSTDLIRNIQKPAQKIAYLKDIVWQNGSFDHISGYFDNSAWLGGNFNKGTFVDSVFNPYADATLNAGTQSFNGDFANCIWNGGDFNNGSFYYSNWVNGNFYNGTMSGANWQNGTWYYGTANNLFWNSGIWKNGQWNGDPFNNNDVDPSTLLMYDGKNKSMLLRVANLLGSNEIHLLNAFRGTSSDELLLSTNFSPNGWTFSDTSSELTNWVSYIPGPRQTVGESLIGYTLSSPLLNLINVSYSQSYTNILDDVILARNPINDSTNHYVVDFVDESNIQDLYTHNIDGSITILKTTTSNFYIEFVARFQYASSFVIPGNVTISLLKNGTILSSNTQSIGNNVYNNFVIYINNISVSSGDTFKITLLTSNSTNGCIIGNVSSYPNVYYISSTIAYYTVEQTWSTGSVLIGENYQMILNGAYVDFTSVTANPIDILNGLNTLINQAGTIRIAKFNGSLIKWNDLGITDPYVNTPVSYMLGSNLVTSTSYQTNPSSNSGFSSNTIGVIISGSIYGTSERLYALSAADNTQSIFTQSSYNISLTVESLQGRTDFRVFVGGKIFAESLTSDLKTYNYSYFPGINEDNTFSIQRTNYTNPDNSYFYLISASIKQVTAFYDSVYNNKLYAIPDYDIFTLGGYAPTSSVQLPQTLILATNIKEGNNSGVVSLNFGNGNFGSAGLSSIWESGYWNNGYRGPRVHILSGSPGGDIIAPPYSVGDDLRRFTGINSYTKINSTTWEVELIALDDLGYFYAGDKVMVGNIVSIDFNLRRRLISNYLQVLEDPYTIIDSNGNILNILLVQVLVNTPIMRIEMDSDIHIILVTKNIWLTGVFLNGYFRGIWGYGLFSGYPYITTMESSHWIDGIFNGGHFISSTSEYVFLGNTITYDTGLIQNFYFNDNNVIADPTLIGTTAGFLFNSWVDVNYYTYSMTNLAKDNIIYDKNFKIQRAEMDLNGYPTNDVLSSESSFRAGFATFSRTFNLGSKYTIYTDFLGDSAFFNTPFSNQEAPGMANFVNNFWTYSNTPNITYTANVLGASDNSLLLVEYNSASNDSEIGIKVGLTGGTEFDSNYNTPGASTFGSFDGSFTSTTRFANLALDNRINVGLWNLHYDSNGGSLSSTSSIYDSYSNPSINWSTPNVYLPFTSQSGYIFNSFIIQTDGEYVVNLELPFYFQGEDSNADWSGAGSVQFKANAYIEICLSGNDPTVENNWIIASQSTMIFFIDTPGGGVGGSTFIKLVSSDGFINFDELYQAAFGEIYIRNLSFYRKSGDYVRFNVYVYTGIQNDSGFPPEQIRFPGGNTHAAFVFTNNPNQPINIGNINAGFIGSNFYSQTNNGYFEIYEASNLNLIENTLSEQIYPDRYSIVEFELEEFSPLEETFNPQYSVITFYNYPNYATQSDSIPSATFTIPVVQSGMTAIGSMPTGWYNGSGGWIVQSISIPSDCYVVLYLNQNFSSDLVLTLNQSVPDMSIYSEFELTQSFKIFNLNQITSTSSIVPPSSSGYPHIFLMNTPADYSLTDVYVDHTTTPNLIKQEFFYNKTALQLYLVSDVNYIAKFNYIDFYEVDMIPFFEYTTEANINQAIRIPLQGTSPYIDLTGYNFNSLGNISLSLEKLTVTNDIVSGFTPYVLYNETTFFATIGFDVNSGFTFSNLLSIAGRPSDPHMTGVYIYDAANGGEIYNYISIFDGSDSIQLSNYQNYLLQTYPNDSDSTIERGQQFIISITQSSDGSTNDISPIDTFIFSANYPMDSNLSPTASSINIQFNVNSICSIYDYWISFPSTQIDPSYKVPLIDIYSNPSILTPGVNKYNFNYNDALSNNALIDLTYFTNFDLYYRPTTGNLPNGYTPDFYYVKTYTVDPFFTMIGLSGSITNVSVPTYSYTIDSASFSVTASGNRYVTVDYLGLTGAYPGMSYVSATNSISYNPVLYTVNTQGYIYPNIVLATVTASAYQVRITTTSSYAATNFIQSVFTQSFRT